MGTFGGLAPFPRRYGGAPTRTSTIVKSLQSQLAPKYDVTDTKGIVWLRINAMARVLAGAWAQNERLANQWTPPKMTDFLPRWEKILGLSPAPPDSLTVRRARVGARMALAGYATLSAIYSTCLAYLGANVFVSIVTETSATAVVWTPTGWPVGSHPALNDEPDWSSTISRIVVLVQQPTAMDWGTFTDTAHSVLPALDAIMPSWTTFRVAKDGTHGRGFYLDEAHNLNWQRFN